MRWSRVVLTTAVSALAWCSPATAAVTSSAPECAGGLAQQYLGETDRNPTNARVEPALGQPLLARRGDGHVAFGFNDVIPLTPNGWPMTPHEQAAAHQVAGSSITRRTIAWGVIELTQGTYDWWGPDQAYCHAKRHGLTPLFVLLGSPRWAVDYSYGCGTGTYGWCMRPPKHSALGALERFAEALAIRYPDALFEAWNEPNLAGFWIDPISPSRYTDVLKAIYTGVKNGNPNAKVISGGLTNTPVNKLDCQYGALVQQGVVQPRTDCYMRYDQFLDGMYASGARDYMDAVGIHPYLLARIGHHDSRFYRTFVDGWSTASPPVRGLFDILRQHGDASRRVAVTEYGISYRPGAAYPSWGTEAAVRDDLLETYRWLDGALDRDGNGVSDIDVDGDGDDDIDMAIFHTMLDNACAKDEECKPDESPGYSWIKQGTETRPINPLKPLSTLGTFAKPGTFYSRQVFCTFATTYGRPLNCAAPIPMTPNP